MSYFEKIKFLLSFGWTNAKYSKISFLSSLPYNCRLIDVGCGNNSPQFIKLLRPDIYYVGIDVSDHNQLGNPLLFADEYILTSPDRFSEAIDQYKGQMDAVLSHHNLEHCNDQLAVLSSMTNALKPNGKLYLSFPCEESINFPHRDGCLNFFDDPTHNQVPCWSSVVHHIEMAGFKFDFTAKRYRPLGLALKGLLLEPLSFWRRQTLIDGSTWALYGFESIIWAAAPTAEVILGDWGPKETVRGQGFNIQTEGLSAMWILVQGLNRYGQVWVEFGNLRPKYPANTWDTYLTTAMPEEIIVTPGFHSVVIVEPTGRRTKVGEFYVME